MTRRLLTTIRLATLALVLGSPWRGHALTTSKPLKQYGRQTWQSDTGLPQNTVREIFQSPDGYIWMATEGGLVRFDGQDFRANETPELPTDWNSGPAAGEQNQLWITGRDGPVLLRSGDRVPRSLGGGGLNVTALLATPEGALIGTDAGVLESVHGGVLKRLGEGTGITSGRVLRLYRDREGSVWIAYDLGVSRLAPEAPGRLQEPLDIPGVLSLFEDREGDMWFGTDVSGATVLREQAFSTLTTQDGLSDDFIRAVFEDRAGTVWLGTNRGGLNRIDHGKISAIRAAGSKDGPSLSSNVVLALAESQGALWIGTPDGLSRLRDGRLKLFTTADGLPDDFVRSLYTDTDGSLWIGTRNGLSHYARGAFTSYSRLDGLGGELIGSILRGRDGTLWVGTLNGLSRFDGNGFRNFTAKDGLGSDAITALVEDREGSLWIASHAFGLTRLSGGVFTPVAAAAVGLPEEIYSMVESGGPMGGDALAPASLWLGSGKGVFRVPLEDLNAFADKRTASLRVETFGTADGMKIGECSSGGHPAAWRMSDGSLWFATLKGAASIQPASGYENRVAPLVAIEDVLVDEVKAAQGQALTVPPGRERITVHYAGLSFRAPQKVRFRYKLEGFDRDWIEAGARRTAFYTNVPAGHYRFLVYASNGDGVWSVLPGEVRFTVRPHFYQTAWFYCLAFALAALLSYAAYHARVRSVELQYRAVLAERNRIAREIHDTLAQGYVGISVQLEVASRLLQVSKEAAAQQLADTKEYVRSSLAEARSSIWNLRSSETGAASETLPARLAAAIKSREQAQGTAAVLRFDVHGSFRPLDRRVEDELLKIALEAVNNALRHASASAIAAALSYDTEWLKLTVSDDGKGFDPAAVGVGHYGVQGMRERAEAIGAGLVIDGGSGGGTTVELTYRLDGRGSQ